MTAHDQPLPPMSIAAEQALLGAILLNNDALDRVRSTVQGDDFGELVHRLMFRAMCERRDAGGSVDASLLSMAIKDVDLGGLTTHEYIARLAATAVTVNRCVDYAKEIRRQADFRRVIGVAQDIYTAVEHPSFTASPAQIAETAIEMLDQVVSFKTAPDSAPMDLDAAAGKALETIGQRREGKIARGASWGILSLDKKTQGMRPGQLIIVAGRPGMGKTTFGVQAALNTALRQNGVYFVSLEMMTQELVERAFSCLCYNPSKEPLTYDRIARAVDLTTEEMDRLEHAQRRLRGVPMIIEQQAGLSLSQIAARARRIKASMDRAGTPLRVIVVDHLGLIRPSDRYRSNRTNEVSEITANLKVLAKELQVAVVALCQLSRATETRDDKRPTLSDLRDSGSIEQDADMVLSLFREAYYLTRKTNRSEAEDERLLDAQMCIDLEVLKQRQGSTGRLSLFCSIGANVIAEPAL